MRKSNIYNGIQSNLYKHPRRILFIQNLSLHHFSLSSHNSNSASCPTTAAAIFFNFWIASYQLASPFNFFTQLDNATFIGDIGWAIHLFLLLPLKLSHILFHCLVETVLEIWAVSKREEDFEPDKKGCEE